MRVLVGDIGGTNTRLAIADAAPARPEIIAQRTAPSAAFPSLAHAIDAFRAEPAARDAGAFDAICLGIAGPIEDGRCGATNLPWVVDTRSLGEHLRVDPAAIRLINDLEAAAFGVKTLGESDVVIFNAGAPSAAGNRAVVSAGTGLGEAGLFWDGSRHVALATEGGHADFAARNQLEFDLLSYLNRRYGRVSYERVLSGPGLLNIYTFLRDTVRGPSESPDVRAALDAHPGKAHPITEAAVRNTCPLCAKTLELFLSIYGAEAGNVALTMLARGGVYLGGGIIGHLAPHVAAHPEHREVFLDAFTSKGRLSALVEA
ncbi:MAG: glucokinase, partial [Planctomycetota bacterium]